MQSESARMSSAAEAKFRIGAPNSRPRAVKVIALDATSERVVKGLARDSWQGATFLTASAFAGRASGDAPERFSLGGWLNDLAGRTKNLVEEVASADLVVMVASAGESAGAAAIIGEACAVRHVMTTALILGTASSSDEARKMLAQLRPNAMMLVISSADEYIIDMLTALRA
jgi:hypothetical protein